MPNTSATVGRATGTDFESTCRTISDVLEIQGHSGNSTFVAAISFLKGRRDNEGTDK